jgi:hypothetical protein
VTRIKQISFNPSVDLGYYSNVKYGMNSLGRIGQYYVFAGQASSFATQLQTFHFQENLENSFVMKYLFDKDTSHQCIFEANVDKKIVLLDMPADITRLDADYRTKTSQVFELEGYLKVYSSPYSGAFELLDTMFIPRPCASASANLT